MGKKGVILGFVFIVLMLFSFVLPDYAQAIPAFARQTGLACSSCHFQHFPSLNAFGRSFKSGGYTMVGGQSIVEGDMLSLPSVLNASVVVKVRYQKTNGNSATGTNMGELQFPDEASVFLGGRAGEHVGFLLEGQIANETVPLFASFKMPFVYDVGSSKFSIIPFITDGLGASFGFELLNTGAVRNVRIIEHRKELSAQQFVGTDGAAEGVAFVGANNMGFLNATVWTPDHGTVAVNGFSHYIRAAATPNLGNWDIGAGIQYWGGTSRTEVGDVDTRAMAVDAQAQGIVGSLPLGVYATYAKADKSNGTTNKFNSNTNDKTAFTVAAELGVIPKKTTVTAGYRSGDTGEAKNSKDNAILLGVIQQVSQNVQFQIDHSIYSGNYYDLPANNEKKNGDQLTTIMMFTAL